MRRTLTSLVAAALLAPASAAAGGARTSIFFYPWYGTPQHDGAFRHWDVAEAGRASPHPGGLIASSYYPARGLYSSSDALVLGAQMREIADAGVEQVAVSWWGPGSIEDGRLPAIAAAARGAGLSLALHVEPYADRTASSTAADVLAFRALGADDVYVYAAQSSPAAEWRAALDGIDGVRVFAHSFLVGWTAAAGFDGIYTYDVLVFGGDRFARLCTQARKAGILCAPSVGPGFDARRSGLSFRVKPRRDGRTYDAMWSAALRADADVVTITSYNEWHEGTQIEAARVRPGYVGYAGAWGKRGRAAERAYLDRTRHWTTRFSRPGPQYRVVASRRR